LAVIGSVPVPDHHWRAQHAHLNRRATKVRVRVWASNAHDPSIPRKSLSIRAAWRNQQRMHSTTGPAAADAPDVAIDWMSQESET